MATFKGTWFYTNTVYNVGWTENWYITATDAPTAYTLTSNYPTVRKNLAITTTLAQYVRISNIDHPRDSLITNLNALAGTIVEATYPIAGVWDVLLCRRDVATWNYFNKINFHLVPAFVFVGRIYGPTGAGAAAWNTAFTAYQTEVESGPYVVHRFSPPSTILYAPCQNFTARYRTERRLGRPSDPLRGRRATA